MSLPPLASIPRLPNFRGPDPRQEWASAWAEPVPFKFGLGLGSRNGVFEGTTFGLPHPSLRDALNMGLAHPHGLRTMGCPVLAESWPDLRSREEARRVPRNAVPLPHSLLGAD